MTAPTARPPRPGWILVACGGIVAASFALDPWAWMVLRHALSYDSWGEMRELLVAAKFLGSGLGVATIAIVIGSLDRWRRAAVLVVAAVVATAAASAVKLATGRERPSHDDQLPGLERRWSFHGPAEGLTHSTYQSFPSGHTACAFASATVLSQLYPPAMPVFYGIAGACGAHRVVTHQHFMSDVGAGAVLGHLVALWVVRWRRSRKWLAAGAVDRRLREP